MDTVEARSAGLMVRGVVKASPEEHKTKSTRHVPPLSACPHPAVAVKSAAVVCASLQGTTFSKLQTWRQLDKCGIRYSEWEAKKSMQSFEHDESKISGKVSAKPACKGRIEIAEICPLKGKIGTDRPCFPERLDYSRNARIVHAGDASVAPM